MFLQWFEQQKGYQTRESASSQNHKNDISMIMIMIKIGLLFSHGKDESPSHWRCGETRKREGDSLRGCKWAWVVPLSATDRRRLWFRAAQCSPCLCLSCLIKTFGFLQPAFKEFVSVWACVWETWEQRGVRGRKCSGLEDFLSFYGQGSSTRAHLQELMDVLHVVHVVVLDKLNMLRQNVLGSDFKNIMDCD